LPGKIPEVRDRVGTDWRVAAGIFCATAGAELTGFLDLVGVLSLPVWLVGVVLLCSSRQIVPWEKMLASAAVPALVIFPLASAHEEGRVCSARFDSTGMSQAQINAKFAQLDSQLGHTCEVDINSAGSALEMLALLAIPALIGLLIWLRVRHRVLRLAHA
jgi:hypothetical protein